MLAVDVLLRVFMMSNAEDVQAGSFPLQPSLAKNDSCNLGLADNGLFVCCWDLPSLLPVNKGFKSASESNLYAQVIAQKQLLERLFQHEMGLPEGRLRRAVSYGGNNERLQRALHKLIRGDPVTVATVGGSVTGAL